MKYLSTFTLLLSLSLLIGFSAGCSPVLSGLEAAYDTAATGQTPAQKRAAIDVNGLRNDVRGLYDQASKAYEEWRQAYWLVKAQATTQPSLAIDPRVAEIIENGIIAADQAKQLGDKYANPENQIDLVEILAGLLGGTTGTAIWRIVKQRAAIARERKRADTEQARFIQTFNGLRKAYPDPKQMPANLRDALEWEQEPDTKELIREMHARLNAKL